MIFKKFNLSGKSFLILLLIFMISVVIRIPNIDRPLSKHHEFVTAISLRVIQIWHEDGGANYNYVPVMNYPGKANKNINNHASPTGGMLDKNGNYYKAFSYILYFFKKTHIFSPHQSQVIYNIFYLSGLKTIKLISALFIHCHSCRTLKGYYYCNVTINYVIIC